MSDTSRGFGYWLSIFANLAVVGGIIFLGVEIRQNSAMMQAQTRHQLAMGIVDILMTDAESPQLTSVVFRGALGEQLSPEEARQWERRVRALFPYWENVHYQYRQGMYDEVEFSSQRDAMRRTMLDWPGYAPLWCEMRNTFSPNFREEMDSFLTARPC